MTEEELVRAVASEMGTDVATEADRQMNGERTRMLAIGASEAILMAGLIVQTAQLAVSLWDSLGDRTAVAARLEAETPRPAGVEEAKRRSIIAHITERLSRSG